MHEVYLNEKTLFSENALDSLIELIAERRKKFLAESAIVLIADEFFKLGSLTKVAILKIDKLFIFYPPHGKEPTTNFVDSLVAEIKKIQYPIAAVVGLGGGSILDTAKAVSNLLGNEGKAEDYQGWELLPKPGIWKIGIPTLFGTGSETSRTCVLLNEEKQIKLGMNSKYSLFDEVVIDHSFSLSCPKITWGLTAMDGYFHATEILHGKARISITDEFAKTSRMLIMEAFNLYKENPSVSAEKIALGSYFGGIALANGTVGLIHPFSAALSVVYDLPHALANCMAMTGLVDFYPTEAEYFSRLCKEFKLLENSLMINDLDENVIDKLIAATVVHEKPLSNHLGENWRQILNKSTMADIFTSILTQKIM